MNDVDYNAKGLRFASKHGVGSGTVRRKSGTPARQKTAKIGRPTLRNHKLYHYRGVLTGGRGISNILQGMSKLEVMSAPLKESSTRSNLDIPYSILGVRSPSSSRSLSTSPQEKHKAGPYGPALRQRAALLIDLHEVAVHPEPHLQFVELLIVRVARRMNVLGFGNELDVVATTNAIRFENSLKLV